MNLPPVTTNAYNCKYCQKTISFEQSVAGDVCDSPECQLESANEIIAEEEQRRQEKLAKEKAFMVKAQGYRDSLVKETGNAELVDVTVGVVPANQATVVDLTDERLTEFRKHLEDTINEAYQLKQAGEGQSTIKREETDSFNNVTTDFEREAQIQACTSCMGFCCLKGGSTYAFQNTENMLNYMERNPDKDNDSILAEYLKYVAPQSYDASCVYHTATGCALPRDMRAAVCNEHKCNGLRDMAVEFYQNKPTKMFIVAENTNQIIRSSLVGENMETQTFVALES